MVPVLAVYQDGFVRAVCEHTYVPIDDGPVVPTPRVGPSERPRLLVWQDELNASLGFQALSLMAYVRRIGYVFQANVMEYQALVAHLQDPAVSFPIFDVSNPRAHDDLLSEVERLLHNVLMALSTRIDQQRAFMKRHFAEDAVFRAEYQAKIGTDFGGYAPSAFLRDLRNYLAHHRLPVAQSRQTISTEAISVTFILVRQPLLGWPCWQSDVKRWLAAQGDQIEIVDLIDSYARIAGSFDEWLHDRIGQMYASEIREYEVDAEAFNQELDRAFGTQRRAG